MNFSILSKIKTITRLDKNSNGVDIAIANILLENLDRLDDISIISLSKKSNVSAASITRFARKLGYDGWKEFNFALKNEYSLQRTKKNGSKNKSPLINYADLITKSISVTAKKNWNTIAEVATKLEKFNECIYLFGIGANMDVIRVFANELQALGFNVRYNSDYNNQIRLSKFVKNIDLAFIFSHSMIGEVIEKIVSNIKSKNCEIILVSHSEMPNTIFLDIPINEAVNTDSHSKSSFAMLFLIYAIVNNIIEFKKK